MLTIIWLIFTTAAGYFIAKYFAPDHVILGAFIGFIVGIVIRFFAGAADDVADIGGSFFD